MGKREPLRAVGPTGSTGLLICLSVHMPGDGFADLPDSWGIAQILPLLWGLASVQLQAPFTRGRSSRLPFSVFVEELQVMPKVNFSLRLVDCGSSCRDRIAQWIYSFPPTSE